MPRNGAQSIGSSRAARRIRACSYNNKAKPSVFWTSSASVMIEKRGWIHTHPMTYHGEGRVQWRRLLDATTSARVFDGWDSQTGANLHDAKPSIESLRVSPTALLFLQSKGKRRNRTISTPIQLRRQTLRFLKKEFTGKATLCYFPNSAIARRSMTSQTKSVCTVKSFV